VPELHFIETAGEDEEDCPGATAGTSETPAAEPGHLCVYAQATGPEFKEIPGVLPAVHRSGATLLFEGTGLAYGTWAVTAE
jgi:hypothetical protein